MHTGRMDAGKHPAPTDRRLVARFHGHVQGVGFRFTARFLAQRAGLSGYVLNLPDGDVELVAEGPEAVLQMFLHDLQASSLGPFILGRDADQQPPTGEFRGFEIRF